MGSTDSTNHGWKNILKKKLPKSFKKQNLICSCLETIYIAFKLYSYSYLHSIYIVFGIISNLEMNLKYMERMGLVW